MSGKLDKQSDVQSPRSQFSALTMKIFDKLQGGRPRRPASLRKSPRTSEENVPQPWQSHMCQGAQRLLEAEREAVASLKYLRQVAGKGVAELLPMSASRMLECMLALQQALLQSNDSAEQLKSQNQILQQVAELVYWADQALLGLVPTGQNQPTLDKSPPVVIETLIRRVQDLVNLSMKNLQRPCGSATLPITVTSPDGEHGSSQTCEQTNGLPSSSSPVCTPTADSEISPPAKPPHPGLYDINTALANRASSPPELPPKMRHTIAGNTPVAVVAPMCRQTTASFNSADGGWLESNMEGRRRFSGGSRSYGGESPSRLSPERPACKLSRSEELLHGVQGSGSPHSLTASTETVDTVDSIDPSFDCHEVSEDSTDDLDSNLPPFPNPEPSTSAVLLPQASLHTTMPISLSLQTARWSEPIHLQRTCTLVDNTQNARQPPALPTKRNRRSAPWNEMGRTPSQYDNVSFDDDALSMGSAPQYNTLVIIAPEGLDKKANPDKPPPLPKKTRVKQYLNVFSDYSEPHKDDLLPDTRTAQRYQVQPESTMVETTTLSPPPALPPKKRSSQEMNNGHDVLLMDTKVSAGIDADVPDGCRSRSQSESEDTAESKILGNKEELWLLCVKELNPRLMFKREDEDGPDLKAGSVNALITRTTVTKDLMYNEAFLTTYRTFMSAHELIKRLKYRYEQISGLTEPKARKATFDTLSLLIRVVDELCVRELEIDTLTPLMAMVLSLLQRGDLRMAQLLREKLIIKATQVQNPPHTVPLSSRTVAARPGTLHDFHSQEIAEQLTLLDSQLFYKIEIAEVLLWPKEQKEEHSPNLTAFTEHFNYMSYWVRSVIIQQEKAQEREKLLLKFMKIMKHLRKLNNFNSYLAVLSALDSAPIRRLEWQKQITEGLAESCTLIDSSSSFRAYRAALAEAEPPCIPYLGLILQDLTFVHLGNPDNVDGKVNFSKRWQQFHLLDSMRRFKQCSYEIERNDDVIAFFNDFSDHLAEEALWEMSLKLKPRNVAQKRAPREDGSSN
uniref:rap guanine nucleotide exchange factor 1-like isoform X2 n=1 Tax=Myxine glutinosa TaxID=7769 RepID=UPI00358F8DBE